MDKELLNKLKACKTVDEMKALLGNRRQLSEGETEQVVGGWTIEKGPTAGTIYLDGQLVDEAGFNSIFMSLTKHEGFYAARDMLYRMTGFWCTEMRDPTHLVSVTEEALKQMDLVLNHFWRVMDGM